MDNKTPATKQPNEDSSSDLMSPPKKNRDTDQMKAKDGGSIGKRFQKA
jgi:hypothetical protein